MDDSVLSVMFGMSRSWATHFDMTQAVTTQAQVVGTHSCAAFAEIKGLLAMERVPWISVGDSLWVIEVSRGSVRNTWHRLPFHSLRGDRTGYGQHSVRHE